jgi:hypothetical protein
MHRHNHPEGTKRQGLGISIRDGRPNVFHKLGTAANILNLGTFHNLSIAHHPNNVVYGLACSRLVSLGARRARSKNVVGHVSLLVSCPTDCRAPNIPEKCGVWVNLRWRSPPG